MAATSAVPKNFVYPEIWGIPRDFFFHLLSNLLPLLSLSLFTSRIRQAIRVRSYRLFGCSKNFVYPEIWRIPCDFFFQLSHHLLSLFVIYTDPVCTDMISSAHRGQPGSLAPSSSSSKRRGKPRTVTASVDRGVGRLGSSDERRDIAKSVTDLGSFGAQVPCTTKADDQRPRRKRAIFALTILYIGILICQMPTHKSKTTTPGQVRAVDLVKYEQGIVPNFVKLAYYD